MNPKIVTTYISLILLMLLSACGDMKGPWYESIDGPVPSESIFPHPDGWEDMGRHGKYVIDNGIASCQNACHGDDFNGGSARSCKSCHENFPHPIDGTWQGISGHGAFVIENGGADGCATKCHGVDLAGGEYNPQEKKSCTKCHESYPHKHSEPGWNETGHKFYLESVDNYEECSTMCHRSDVPEKLKVKDCADCHASYPEQHDDAGWMKTRHKEFIESIGGIGESNCTLCHGEKLDGGKSEVSCIASECHHSGGPNKVEWKDKSEHGFAAADGSILSCTGCHGGDLKGNAVVEGCDECHHKNWEEDHEKPWADISQHGVPGVEPAQSCKTCHGGDLEGGLSKVSCKTCHDGIYPHPVDWDKKEAHGLIARIGMDKCVRCHGDITSKDCVECHHDSEDDWVETVVEEKPSHTKAFEQDTDSCQFCHGDDLKGGMSISSCYECHDPGNNYRYEEGSHPKDWKEQFNHGIAYKNRKKNCKTACHGKELDGGLSSVTCVKCHEKYPHEKGWYDYHTDPYITSSDNLNKEALEKNCMKCHGGFYTHKKGVYPDNMSFQEKIDLSFVRNPENGSLVAVRCYGCHFAYPHVKGISPSTGDELPWLEAHTKEITKSWGEIDKTCVVADSCHYSKRQSTNPVKAQNGNWKTINLEYCTEFCHKKK